MWDRISARPRGGLWWDNPYDRQNRIQDNQNDIALVILDMVMPGLNGGETFEELKKIDPNSQILLSSGYALNGDAAEIINRGCEGFIQKPFNIKSLSTKVRDILDN